jgi:hypothetical protein
MSFFDRPLVIPSLFIAIALLAGLAVVGWGISARGQQDTISVTGSASTAATADTATWAIDISETAYPDDIAAAADRISNDANTVAKYFASQKLASSTVTISTVSENANYSANNGALSNYNITDTVTLSTSDVHTIDSLSHDIGALNDLVADGTVVSPEQPQYYLSTLPTLRVSLLGAAIKDAKARASQIAQSGGSSVGPLETASSGVVQVLAPNSSNSEDDGQYDTSTIQKEVTVTVRADFYVR